MIYELLYKRDGVIKTPTYSPLTKSPLSSFKYPSPSPKYSHKSPSIQGSTSEIIETYSASIFNYDYFDSQLNNYRMDKSKNSLVDRVIKKCIQHEENRRSKMSEIVELFNQKGKKQLEDDKGEEISYFLD
ncbi:unnamed protein product [Meloidogyne enterolobii]|uniref:Uncharacterized protein n=1 Tax=Meloidogyne enterolobii TaxID=390850 RepID=A0ACB0ZRJ7_MELEN